MTRDEAIAIACRHAAQSGRAYYGEGFVPHEWVIEAIIEAAAGGERMRLVAGIASGKGLRYLVDPRPAAEPAPAFNLESAKVTFVGQSVHRNCCGLMPTDTHCLGCPKVGRG